MGFCRESEASDDADLDVIQRKFTPSLWVKRIRPSLVVEEHVKFVTAESCKVKATQSCRLDVSYGKSEGQKVDLYGFTQVEENAKILIYVHGGYWQEMSREISAYCVPPLIANGIAVAVMGYDLAPAVLLDEIVEQIENGVKFVAEIAEQKKSKGIYLCGHSAGAHLIAMLLNSKLVSNNPDLFKGFLMISGIYDLQLLTLTDVNSNLNLDKIKALQLSPMLSANLIPKKILENVKLDLVVGEFESPEFISQTEKYAQVLKYNGAQHVNSFVFPLMDHFNIVEELSHLLSLILL